MKRFAVYPGYVRSRSDGQVHYVGAAQLMDLYGVRPEECVVIRHDRDKIAARGLLDTLLALDPVSSGEYRRVTEAERARHPLGPGTRVGASGGRGETVQI